MKKIVLIFIAFFCTLSMTSCSKKINNEFFGKDTLSNYALSLSFPEASSGQSLLNTNYYFSKKIAYYQSLYDKCYPNHKKGETTNRIKHLYELKKKRINLILHRASRYIVNYCNNHDISKVIIGDVTGILHQKKEFNSNKDK